MDRTRSVGVTFAVNFAVGYLLGRLLGGRDTAVRAGLALGGLGAAATWRLADRLGAEHVEPPSEPIEIEIEE